MLCQSQNAFKRELIEILYDKLEVLVQTKDEYRKIIMMLSDISSYFKQTNYYQTVQQVIGIDKILFSYFAKR